MARPAKYKCPTCRTTGTGGTGPRTGLQMKYKNHKPIKIYCKQCGATGDPTNERWLTALGRELKVKKIFPG